MDYQKAIETHINECRHRIDVIRRYVNTNGDADTDVCNKNIEVLEISISAMQELQAIHNNGISLDRLKDIDFRKQVVEHINYMEYMDIKDELEEYKRLGDLEEVREAVERQRPRKAILKNGKSGMFVDYADGHGEYKVTKWQDWCCPVCGWFVGQRYNTLQSKSHDQRKSKYCNECGTKIDWSEEE